MAADGGCESDVVHRMNEGYKAWGALKTVLCNRGLGINANNCILEQKRGAWEVQGEGK